MGKIYIAIFSIYLNKYLNTMQKESVSISSGRIKKMKVLNYINYMGTSIRDINSNGKKLKAYKWFNSMYLSFCIIILLTENIWK